MSEGTKVKINCDAIASRPDYYKMRKEYRDFIINNRDKIFTVEYDDRHRDKPYLVCFKEDTSPIKWLWDITSDLIVIPNNDNKIKINK